MILPHQHPMNMQATAVSSSPARAETGKSLLVVDDHPVFRHGICQFLLQLSDFRICAEAANAQKALEAMRLHQPDMVLLDVSLPGTNGIELIKHMLAEQPALIILILSMYDESLYALRALRAGAKGYVMKQQAMENILDALKKVSRGGIYVSPRFSEKLIFKTIAGAANGLGSPVEKLSDRQLEVLQLFGRNKTTREISEMLHLSAKTIETHRSHIKEKLGLKDAEELMDFALEWMTTQEG